MTRKHKQLRFSEYKIPANDIDPNVPTGVRDEDAVRFAMVDFEELALLPAAAAEQLVADLVDAIRYRRGGLKAGKRGVSDVALAQQVFLSDFERALKNAGLPVKRWRKRYDQGDRPSVEAPESFYFRFARAIAYEAGMTLPVDLKLPAKRAAQHQYGVTSPVMQAARKQK
jgi:hypothetical protein